MHNQSSQLMIVRDAGDSFLLITQPDHAYLAETIVAAVRTEASLSGNERRTILYATREHDNGWAEVDALPTVDPIRERPCDFMAGPASVKHDLWLRGITRVAKTNILAGALVAEHALTVYTYRRSDDAWAPFFSSIEAMRDALLQRCGRADGPPRDEFASYYRCVRLGDSLSLQFCNGWRTPSETLGYRIRLDDTSLLISPDPFAGATIDLKVVARRIPAERYANDARVRAALAAATPEILTGTAQGM
jgi:hypothetical protein